METINIMLSCIPLIHEICGTHQSIHRITLLTKTTKVSSVLNFIFPQRILAV